MKTVLVTANDTGSGKTHVTAIIARRLLGRGNSVEVVKLVETGITASASGDAQKVAGKLERLGASCDRWKTRTPFQYERPMAPVQAAELEGKTLSYEQLRAQLEPSAEFNWRIVEGAGGIAVPLESKQAPRDWADLARDLQFDYVLIVVENRLGAINQARVTASYASAHQLNFGIWLNQVTATVSPEVLESNLQSIAGSDIPIWGRTDYDDEAGHFFYTEWLG